MYNGNTIVRGINIMSKSRAIRAAKEARLSIRVAAAWRAVIARAAKLHGDTISNFVLENADQMATELLADEGVVSLGKKQLARIFEALDHPSTKSAAAIRKLLSERSVLDG